MIQRFVYTVLSQAVAALSTDPTIIPELFGAQYGLSETEVAGIATYFASHPPRVAQGYAHADATMPMYAIVMQSEQMSNMYVGDDAGPATLDPTDAQYGQRQVGAIWQSSYQILCYAEHPDVVTYMYEIAKAAMLANQGYFVDNDVDDTVLSGNDIAPDPRYMPEHIFCRALGFRCTREFASVDNSSVARAFSIVGVALPTGSLLDPGTVLQNIDPTGDSDG